MSAIEFCTREFKLSDFVFEILMLVIVQSSLGLLIIFTTSILNACVLILRKVTIGDKF